MTWSEIAWRLVVLARVHARQARKAWRRWRRRRRFRHAYPADPLKRYFAAMRAGDLSVMPPPQYYALFNQEKPVGPPNRTIRA